MPKNVGKVVTLICTYIGKNERGQAVVRTSDGVDIVAVLPPGESFERLVVECAAIQLFLKSYLVKFPK